MEKIFADGFNFKEPHPGAPDFVVGALYAKVDKAIAFLKQHQNDRGYVNMDIKRSKGGQHYIELNTWKPSKNEQGEWTPKEDDAPF